KLSGVHKPDSIPKMLLATLPLPYLHNLLIFFGRCNHNFTLPDRVTDRLFYIHMFSGFHSIHHLQTMPMIWGGYNDSINGVACQQFLIVYITFDGNIPVTQLCYTFIEYPLIHIAKRRTLDMRQFQYRVQIRPAHTVYTYQP